MTIVTATQQHDYRRLTRVTLTEQAAADLAAWKERSWTEFYGHGCGTTEPATGDIQEILTAVVDAVKAAGIDEVNPVTGSCHAVIYSENGDLIHATLIGRQSLEEGFTLNG